MAARPVSRISQATMPVIVLLPLVPAIATLGWPALTTSASSAGRGMRVSPSRAAACISGVLASTAVEWTKRPISRVIALPSWGRMAMPAERSRVATSRFFP